MAAIATELRTRLGDVALYGLSAAFALLTAATSTLLPHRAWGTIAWWGYAGACIVALVLVRSASTRTRAWLTAAAFVAVTLVPLLTQAVQRAAGRTDRAQEEVLVVEDAGDRLLHTGTPYLSRDAIAALPADERLLGYTPYQPGMAMFGLPRALFGPTWWTDARIWFAAATVAALLLACRLLAGIAAPPRLVLVAQAVGVLPICALTLSTGGDDLPVLALCLLALALTARDRPVASGIAVGLAGTLKLFALPVAVVLLVLAWQRRSGAARFGAGAFGLPALAVLPALLLEPDAFVENVLRFPSGRGLVTSPAQSPLPGHLIATAVPGGRYISLALRLLAGTALAWWLLRRPPAGAGPAALVIAVGLTAAIMLTPTTRFGYLLYPAAFTALWWALRPAHNRYVRTVTVPANAA